ncbi:MAG TPA: hypothetical protein VFR70_07100 [Flavobacterium sp.]|nr:hypothetical protein [Flavobacterium sp.]
MEVCKICIATLVGTTIMTAFSYLVSESFKKLFKEPVLLNLLIAKSELNISPERKNILGWLIHYAIGLSFVIAYHLVWKHTEIDPTWFSGLIFGIVSGFIGIASWHFMFRLSKNPPQIHFKEYYIQLFIAHIFFALGVVATYKAF